MSGLGELGGEMQCKLVPLGCLSVLFAAHVSLHSRLSSGAADLFVRRENNKNKKEW